MQISTSIAPLRIYCGGFTNTEATMAAHHAHKKAIHVKKKATPPNIINASTVVMSKVSLLTTAVTGGKSTSPPLTLKTRATVAKWLDLWFK